MALSPDGRKAAVSCSRSNDVWLLDLASEAGSRFDTSAEPGGVAYHPDGLSIFLGEPALGSVAQVKLKELRAGRRWRSPGAPLLVEVDGSLSRLMVGTGEGGELALVRVKDLRLEKTLRLGGAPLALWTPAGRDWLALTRQADSVVKISSKDLNPSASLLPGLRPAGMDVDRIGSRALVACEGAAGTWQGGGLALLRLGDFRKVDFLPVDGGPQRAYFGPGGERAWVVCADGTLKLVSLAHGEVLGSLALGAQVGAAVPLKHGAELLLALSSQRKVLRVGLGRVP